MFTGIITEIGRIRSISRGRHWTVTVDAIHTVKAIYEGASVSVSGVCVTAVTLDSTGFSFHLSPETIQRTTFRTKKAHDYVNLELAMRADGRFDGHIVQGHVDDTGRISRMTGDGTRELTIAPQKTPGALIVEKGSIAIDGISLTIARIENDRDVTVALIPLSIESTTLRHARPGDSVNLEYDIFGKYMVRMKRF